MNTTALYIVLYTAPICSTEDCRAALSTSLHPSVQLQILKLSCMNTSWRFFNEMQSALEVREKKNGEAFITTKSHLTMSAPDM